MGGATSSINLATNMAQTPKRHMFVRVQYPGEDVLGKKIEKTDLDKLLDDIHQVLINSM